MLKSQDKKGILKNSSSPSAPVAFDKPQLLFVANALAEFNLFNPNPAAIVKNNTSIPVHASYLNPYPAKKARNKQNNQHKASQHTNSSSVDPLLSQLSNNASTTETISRINSLDPPVFLGNEMSQINSVDNINDTNEDPTIARSLSNASLLLPGAVPLNNKAILLPLNHDSSLHNPKDSSPQFFAQRFSHSLPNRGETSTALILANSNAANHEAQDPSSLPACGDFYSEVSTRLTDLDKRLALIEFNQVQINKIITTSQAIARGAGNKSQINPLINAEKGAVKDKDNRCWIDGCNNRVIAHCEWRLADSDQTAHLHMTKYEIAATGCNRKLCSVHTIRMQLLRNLYQPRIYALCSTHVKDAQTYQKEKIKQADICCYNCTIQ
jgi:hypothetical protein